MSVSVTIKSWLKDKVTALSSVQSVNAYESVSFSGYPAVTITPANMNGEFTSSSENSRRYAFNIRIFLPLGQDPPNKPVGTPREEYVDSVIATVIDDIINACDTNFAVSGLSPTALFVEAADVAWGYIALESGDHRTANLEVIFYTEKTVV